MRDKLIILLVALLVMSGDLYAQKLIKGEVVVKNTIQPLENALVMVLNKKDSLIIQYCRTDQNGSFLINVQDSGEYILSVSYPRFQGVHKTLKVSDRISDKINITLDRLENIIDEVVINKDILRIKLNGDTTEYTVAAMSLGKNDKVGSLLQKLHGITVSDDGTVMVKNKVVSKIYIDGQEYFSYDPRIIVRNVRADAVKKVQVYDEETELTKSTRINDGKKIQVANIILKEEAKKSVFGNVAANYGSKGRYGLALFGGLFNNSRKIGINTSISSLASNEIFVVPKIIGNPETRNYALTYNDELKKNLHFNNEISVNENRNETTTDNLEKQFLENDFRSNFSSSKNQSGNRMLRLNSRLTGNLGNDLELDFKLKSTAGHHLYHSSRYAVSTKEDSSIINSQNDTSNVNSRSYSFNPFFQIKFNISKEKRRYLLMVLNSGNVYTNAIDTKRNLTYFSKNTDTVVLDNQSVNKNTAHNLFSFLTYGTGIDKYSNLSLSYSVNIDSKNESFLFRDTDPGTNIPNDPSYNYRSTSKSEGLSMSYSLNKGKVQTSLSGYVLASKLKLHALSGDNYNLKKDFLSGNFSLLTRYQLSERSQISSQYKYNLIIPTIFQMTAFRPIINPVTIYIGNINLESSKNHFFNGNYGYFNSFRNITIGSQVEFSMTTNPVISKLDIDEQGKTYYSNVNDHDMALKQFNANLNFSKGLLKNSVIIGPAINYSFSSFSEILNNTLAKNKISNFSIGGTLTKQNRKTFDFTLRFNFGIDAVINDNVKSKFQNRLMYVTSSFTIDTKLYLGKGFQISQRSSLEQFGKDVYSDKLLKQKYTNVQITKELNKQNMTISIKAYDIFSSYNNVIQKFSPNRFLQYNEGFISQYFLLGLKWDFNKKI